MSEKKEIKKRLEFLRIELRLERISYGELFELQSLVEHIDLNDVELLEAEENIVKSKEKAIADRFMIAEQKWVKAQFEKTILLSELSKYKSKAGEEEGKDEFPPVGGEVINNDDQNIRNRLAKAEEGYDRAVKEKNEVEGELNVARNKIIELEARVVELRGNITEIAAIKSSINKSGSKYLG